MAQARKELLYKDGKQGVQALYDKYGGMLFGYVLEVVRSRSLAEEYVVKIFSDLAVSYDELDWTSANDWTRLLGFAKGKLQEVEVPEMIDLESRGRVKIHFANNNCLNRLNEEQKRVFYMIYYSGKSVRTVAKKIAKSEEAVKALLNEAFNIIRKAVEIREYIESGVLEAYILGAATEREKDELQFMKVKYPEVGDALFKLEQDLEQIAQHMAIQPPPGIWNRIEDTIGELARQKRADETRLKIHSRRDEPRKKAPKGGQFIEVQGESSHMRVHKLWRWAFAAVFILGKIFLAFAIYFYLENRQIRQEVQHLKEEIRLLKR
jgi:DNA-directed RNA polymerase specialized sigma24 family protein